MMFVKGVANATPFFLLLFLGLLYKQILFVKAVANAKNRRPCFLGQGLLVTTTTDITPLFIRTTFRSLPMP